MMRSALDFIGRLDFALIIVVLTALAGVIWLLDALFLRPARVARAARGDQVKEPIAVDYARSFFPVLLIVLVSGALIAAWATVMTGQVLYAETFAEGVKRRLARQNGDALARQHVLTSVLTKSAAPAVTW